MNADRRVWFRMFVCAAFIFSLYGGMALLTAAMFAKGLVLLGLLSGLVLSAMTAMALGLFGLAWAMTSSGGPDDQTDLLAQPG